MYACVLRHVLTGGRVGACVQMLSGSASRTEPVPAGIDEYIDSVALKECNSIRESW